MPFNSTSPEQSQYAISQNEAERASIHPEESFTHLNPGQEAEFDPESGRADNTGNDQPRSDAKIWSLYLKEAEEKAKQRVEEWKTDLESVLLFAGLFAGVVASFVIDGRRDLQPQTKTEVLLADIRNVLRNEANPRDMFEVPTSTLWINGLWFASLLITLFCATMGILAKSWVVQFILAPNGQGSNDAYHRWVRDEKVELWYLGAAITILLGLLHLALLLFCLGFALQSLNDNPKLGCMVFALVFLVIIIYLTITVAPFFFPGIPCQTPLSAILSSGGHISVIKPSGPSHRHNNSLIQHTYLRMPEKRDVLLEIWHSQLDQSTRPSNIDTAVTEITQKQLTNDWWEYFVQWGTPEILRKRLRELMLDGFKHNTRETPYHYLRALSGFINYFGSDHKRLISELGANLDLGNPLYRWDIFPEDTRALAFSVRTPILLACNRDYSDSEMEERPWEAMVHHMLPGHRRDFAMAACRGLIGDQKNLRMVSALSIVIFIAKSTVATVKPIGEWRIEVGKTARERVNRMAQIYLKKLFKEIAEGWERSLPESTSKDLSVTMISESRDLGTAVLDDLAQDLGHRNPQIRTNAITRLGALVIDSNAEDVVEPLISRLAQVIANDADQNVRDKGIETLTLVLVHKTAFQNLANKALLEYLRLRLEEFSWLRISHSIPPTDDMVTLIQYPSFQAAFPDVVGPLISDIINLTIVGKHEDTRAAAGRAVGVLVHDEKLQDRFKLGLSITIKTELRKLPWVDGFYPINRLALLVTSLGFQDMLNSEILDLFKSTREADFLGLDIRIVRMKNFISLAHSEVLQHTILPELPHILHIVRTEIPERVHASWIEVFVFLTNNYKDDFRESIKLAIPTLLGMTINGTHEYIHYVGVEALILLAEDNSLKDSIKQSFSSNLESALMTPSAAARLCTLKTLVKLAKKFNPGNLTKDVIQAVARMAVNDDDNSVRIAGMNSLISLKQDADRVSLSLPQNLVSEFKKAHASNRVNVVRMFTMHDPQTSFPVQFRNIMKSAIPNVVEIAVGDENPNVQEAGMQLASFLVQDDRFHDVVKPVTSKILASAIEDSFWLVRIAWLELLVNMSRFPTFQTFVEVALPKSVNIAINDQYEYVRVAGIKSLGCLAQYDNYRRAIKPGLNTLINLTQQDYWEAGVACIWLHVTLAQIPDFQAEIESRIPKLGAIVVEGANVNLCIAGVDSLVTLAQNEMFWVSGPTVWGVIKSALHKCLDSASKKRDSGIRLAWIRALIALSRDSDFRDDIVQAIPKLFKITMFGKDSNVCEIGMKALTSLMQDNTLNVQNTIISTLLPKDLGSVFDSPTHHLRAGWFQMVATLTCYDTRLGGAIEPAIPKFVNIAMHNGDKLLRIAMIEQLALLAGDATLGDIIRSTLSRELDLALNIQDWTVRVGAIELLKELIQHPHLVQDPVGPVISRIINMSIHDEDEKVSKAAVVLLDELETGKNRDGRKIISNAVMLAVPSVMALINPGRHNVQKIIKSLLNFAGQDAYSELAKPMAWVLTPMLTNNFWLTRVAAVETIGALHYYEAFWPFIQSAVPGIIMLALEDVEENVRIAGIRSLADLAGEAAFRDNIKAILHQLIPLLDLKYFRTPVVKLISSLATDDTVRKDIISYIIKPLINFDAGEPYPDGLLELLSTLIIDKRFNYSHASDYVVLSITSVILMQPHTASFRARTVDPLWYNYGVTYTDSQPATGFPADLVESFLFTLFGWHITLEEVTRWRAIGSL